MNHVLYYSMTGNTKKMAAAIAAELGVEARDVRKATGLPQDGLLFIGSGCYGDKPGEDLAKFLANNDLAGRKVALFGTSGAGAGKEVESMAATLKSKGAVVVGSYHSKGKAFVIVNLGHPNKDELDGARRFAREMVTQNG
ncbi:MAG: flavodoxin [Methanocella sp. PtaU1.Bin125]|nr:MAG: flavodoxin [Methanocella sp. PtaU1.Bin125]